MRLFLCFCLLLLSLAVFAAPDPDNFRDGDASPVTLAIGRMPAPPALDGTMGGWPDNSSTFLLGQNTQTGRRFNWGGTRDVSGSVRLAWDATYLYLAADIVDDHLDQATGGAQIWQGDTLELFFNIHPRIQRVDGFWQEALVPPLEPGYVLKATGPQKDFVGVEGATKIHPGGYTLECRIPWTNLTGFTPAVGSQLGFQIYVDDRDGVGRKTQLLWYPSAISFSRPTHTNVVVLSDQGDTSQPKVLAGPNDWCVTDPATMSVSAVSDIVGASSATVTLLSPPAGATEAAGPVTFDMQMIGDTVSVGAAKMPIVGVSGLQTYKVSVADSQGKVLATNTFQTELVGAKFQQMRAENDALKTRVTADKARTDLDTAAMAGLDAWYTRVSAFVYNEARPEALSASLLDQMLTEYAGIDNALTTLEAGRDPYAGRTGSFVRAYKSPLTGQYRPCGLFVPDSYVPGTAKRYPLIVLLHSIFADERMLSLMAGTYRDLGAIVYQGAAYRQFDWGGISAAETWAGLDQVEKLYPIDESRVYLIGYHIGGRGVWQLSEARPDRFAAIAPIFSGIDTGPNYPALRLYPQFYAQAVNVQIPPPQFTAPPMPAPITDPLQKLLYQQDSLVTRLPNIVGIPMRSAYGEDDPNASAEYREIRATLDKLGAPLTTHYVPGAMHGTPSDDLRDPAFYAWLLAQHRPEYPKTVSFTATNLRDNGAWWVRIDQFDSPDQVGRIDAAVVGGKINVTTSHAGAISLLLDSRLAPAGTALNVTIDGQKTATVTVGKTPTWLSMVRNSSGNWVSGQVPPTQKHSGLSGPIDDFQRERFVFVYGTGGDEAAQATAVTQAAKLADWGLGAVFLSKADKDITDDDLANSTVILIGTPATNSLLAKMSDRLPLKWTSSGLTLGGVGVDGPGAGACVIVPNPLSPNRYAVILTATDDAGYQVWNDRNPGGDYVLGTVATGADGKSKFVTKARGWFDNSWQWSATLCSTAGD